MIHCWIIFNILYSLLFFMIDDWIHSNINPCRSSVSIWLSISYSLYKPLATWIVLMQWSEMKKSVPTDKTGEEKANKSGGSGGSQYLNKTTIKGLTPPPTLLSKNSPNPSLSTSETTKESTIVNVDIGDFTNIATDIGSLYPNDSNPVEKESNTAAALMLAVSTLRLAADNSVKSQQNQVQNADFDEEDDGVDADYDGEDGDEDDDDDDDDDDTEGEERERGDLEKGSENEADTVISSNTPLNQGSACGESETGRNKVILARGRRSNGYIVTH